MSTPININDAIHNLWSIRTFDWLRNSTPSCLTKQNNPILAKLSPNFVPTWGDWVRILAGGGGES